MSDYEEIFPASKDDELVGISTGLPQLDRMIGPVGGIPVGRISLLTGKYSTGKTSLALFIIASAQKKGMECLLVDSEMAFDKEHARMCGVDVGKLQIMRQNSHAEKVLDTVERFLAGNEHEKLKPHKNALVVLDSYSGLSIADEVSKDASGADYGAKAKMFTRFLRKIKTPIKMHGSVLVVLGHEYPSMTMPVYMILAGGDGMAKGPSLWLDLKKKPGVFLKSGDERVGEVIVATAKKNKIGGKKYAESDLQFVFGSGWNPVADYVQDALDRGIITKEGNSYYFAQEKIAVGRPKLDAWAKLNAEELKKSL